MATLMFIATSEPTITYKNLAGNTVNSVSSRSGAQSAADETPALQHRIHGWQELAPNLSLHDVPVRSPSQDLLHNIEGRFLAEKKDFGFGRKLSNSIGRFDSVQVRHPNVQ